MESEEKQRNYELAERLIKEQSFALAIVSGTITMILGCGIYAVTAVAAGGESVGVMVVGIGVAIGFAMQFLGRGMTTKFAVAGSFLGMICYPAAKLFTITLYTAKLEQISPLELLSSERMTAMWNWVLAGVRPLDLLFWLVAIGAAAYLSKRRLSREESLAIYTYEYKH